MSQTAEDHITQNKPQSTAKTETEMRTRRGEAVDNGLRGGGREQRARVRVQLTCTTRNEQRT